MPPASGSSRPETSTDLSGLSSVDSCLARPLLPPDLASSAAVDKEMDIVSLGAQLEQATEQVEMEEDEGEIMEPYEFLAFSDYRSRLARPLYAPERSTPPPESTVQSAAWDRFSLPLTEVAVNQFKKVKTADAQAGKGLGRLDPDRAFSIARRVCVTSPSLVLALIYLERMRKSNPKYLTTVSSTDIFLVSLMVSSKFLHDDGEDDEVFNEDWAEAGQIATADINKLEIDFLCALEWKLLVSPDEFDGMTTRLETAVAKNEVDKRGWATYSDMAVLLDYMQLLGMWHTLKECAWKITALCAATYAAQLMTLLGTVYMLNKTPLGPQNMANLLQRHAHAASPTPSTSSSSPVAASPRPTPTAPLVADEAFPDMDTILRDQEAEIAAPPSNKSSFLPFSEDNAPREGPFGHHPFNHHETAGPADFLLQLRHAPSQLLKMPLGHTLNRKEGASAWDGGGGSQVHGILEKYFNLLPSSSSNGDESSGFCPVRDGFLRPFGSLLSAAGNQGMLKNMVMV